MVTNVLCSGNGSGILEQLEDCLRLKINSIKGLLELRSNEPNERYKEVFEDVLRTFSEVDELVDTLTSKVEHEKTYVKYVSSILKSNELQMSKLKKLSELVSGRSESDSQSTKSVESLPDSGAKEANKDSEESKNAYSNRIPLSRSFKSNKLGTFKNTGKPTQNFRISTKVVK